MFFEEKEDSGLLFIDCFSDYITAKIEETTRSVAKTMVNLNRNFLKPLLVWYVPPPSFPLPNAEPSPASDFCSKILIINSIDSIICTQGNILFIGCILARFEK